MKISGFTILRQTVCLGYPFVESIRSLLPLVDELVVGVGDGNDGTWEAVHAIGDAKIKAFRSVWDLSQRVGGQVLAEQTNLALSRCSGEWAVYLQADEVLHEDDLENIHASMCRHRYDRTEGLLFNYLHFYGSYHTVGDDWRKWYPRAVRAVKIGVGVQSVGDACGFRICRSNVSRGLIKADSGGRVFHYGWCRLPSAMIEKQKNLGGCPKKPQLSSR